jgi:hypothetical protein
MSEQLEGLGLASSSALCLLLSRPVYSFFLFRFFDFLLEIRLRYHLLNRECHNPNLPFIQLILKQFPVPHTISHGN